MSELLRFQKPFDYFELPEDERTWLREREDRIIDYCRRTLADHIRAGEVLLEVHNRLPRHFKSWLASNTPLSRATAHRLERVAIDFKAFVESHGETQVIEARALYALSEPGVRPASRLAAIELAGKKEPVTLTVARELIAKYKPDAPVQRKMFGDDPAPAPVDHRPLTAWEKLEKLVRSGLGVTFEPPIEDQDDEAETLFCVRFTPKKGPAQFGTGRNLIEAVEHLAKEEPTKPCSYCGQVKPLRMFTVKSSHSDGRASECQTCSRARVDAAKKDRQHRKAA